MWASYECSLHTFVDIFCHYFMQVWIRPGSSQRSPAPSSTSNAGSGTTSLSGQVCLVSTVVVPTHTIIYHHLTRLVWKRIRHRPRGEQPEGALRHRLEPALHQHLPLPCRKAIHSHQYGDLWAGSRPLGQGVSASRIEEVI